MNPVRTLTVKGVPVRVYASVAEMGRAAAAEAAGVLREAVARRGGARLVVGTGTSQLELVGALVRDGTVDWARIDVLHMDEYVGMPATHPASFRRWLKTHLADRVGPRRVHFMEGDAADPERECRRYADLLRAEPVDLCFVGFGENGHIAFNDPHVADFKDPLWVKRVTLDDRSRRQQVGEGNFPTLDAAPRVAMTITCPALMSAERLICFVPERRKAEAVRNALEGPLSPACPASLVFTHPRASVYLDTESASGLARGPA